jgi:hypothetical protein
MVCLWNICINTLHKGDSDDDDGDDDDDDDDNNNNNKCTASHCNPFSQPVFSVSHVMLGSVKYTKILLESDAVSTGTCLPDDT